MRDEFLQYLFDADTPLTEAARCAYISLFETPGCIGTMYDGDIVLEATAGKRLRECTEEEVARCVGFAYNDVYGWQGRTEENIMKWFKVYINMYLDVWRRKGIHAYTIDGGQCFMLCRPDAYMYRSDVYETPTENYLALAYVNPESRGHGVATRMLSQCMKDSPNGVILETQRDNKSMLGLAKKLGYEISFNELGALCKWHPNVPAKRRPAKSRNAKK